MAAGRITASYCAGEVRRRDGERYLSALFAPEAWREDLFALHAFDLEIARTRGVMGEPLIGAMRLQWWRDTLAAIHAGRPPAQPVAEALGIAVQRRGLALEPFLDLIDAHAHDLADEEAPADLDVLASQAEARAAPLVLLALDILGVSGAVAREAGRHVAIAWALAGILRAVPAHVRAGRQCLPPATDERAVVTEIACLARDNLRRARAIRRGVPGAALPVLLLAPLTDAYLRRLRRAQYDPHATGIETSGPMCQWHLLRHAIFGRY
jgi:NADH dehydrogenase [ubiquinone] 1 alpha subcomplex assembly factor 6